MTISITGKSGSVYEFTVYSANQAFKAVGGVYVVLKQAPQTTNHYWYRYVYVGETGDLSTRFENHHKADCFTKHGADHIGVHLDNSATSRRAKESDILNGTTRWPCND